MSDQDVNVFEETTAPISEQPSVSEATPAAPSKPVDPYLEMLNGITAPDGRKKYATVSDALNSIPHKESHIQNIESENASLKAELEKLQRQALVAEQLQTTPKPATEPPTSGTPANTGDLSELIRQELQRTKEAENLQKQQETKQQNLAAFNKALKDTYGDRAREEFNAKVKEFGLNVGTVQNWAADNPQAMLKALGIGATPKQQSTVPYSPTNANPTKPADVDVLGIPTGAGARWKAVADEYMKEQQNR